VEDLEFSLLAPDLLFTGRRFRPERGERFDPRRRWNHKFNPEDGREATAAIKKALGRIFSLAKGN
jgi:hypothetical protein